MLKLITLIKSRSKKLGVRCYRNRLPTILPQKTNSVGRFGVGLVACDIKDYTLWRPRPRQLHINRFSDRNGPASPDAGSKEEDTKRDGGGDWTPNNGAVLRWGIAPVSLMADDFAMALSVLPPNQHRIVSCVAPYQSHALAFAERHNVENVYTSFEDLAKCPNVDVVYISPLNPQHSELCHLMLNHDKHVLCEKPLCMTEEQVKQVLEKARARSLFLMEGMWPRCVPAYHYIRHQILRNRLGELQHVHCTLGLPISPSRLALYGGVTTDFGVYGLQLALWIFREVPSSIQVSGRVNADNVDVAADIELTFSRNQIATIEVSSEKRLDNLAIIQGKDGCIKMSNYWCPTRLVTEEADFEFPLPGLDQALPTHYHNRLGMCYEAEEVRNCILKGKNESDVFSHNESLLLANLIDSIHAELGVGSYAVTQKVPDLQAEIELARDIVVDPEELASETCRVVQKIDVGESLESPETHKELTMEATTQPRPKVSQTPP